MIYQFDESWNGRVVAEQVDYSRTKDLFRGLNFPASDIPAQARELYRAFQSCITQHAQDPELTTRFIPFFGGVGINKVRLLYDRDAPSARMCCRSIDEVNTPLDMTHCHLRAMSPIHIKVRLFPFLLPLLLNLTTSTHSISATWVFALRCQFLSRRSGISGACSSISLVLVPFPLADYLSPPSFLPLLLLLHPTLLSQRPLFFNSVSLHTYGRFGRRISFPVRKLCKLLGQSISRNIERLSMQRRLQARKLIDTSTTDANPSGFIVARAEDLLHLFDSHLGLLSVGDEAKVRPRLSYPLSLTSN
jgi:hypothetical protein